MPARFGAFIAAFMRIARQSNGKVLFLGLHCGLAFNYILIAVCLYFAKITRTIERVPMSAPPGGAIVGYDRQTVLRSRFHGLMQR